MASNEDGWLDEWFDEPDITDYKDLLFGSPNEIDEYAQVLYFSAYFDKDQAAYDELVGYMESTYGIDWESVYDWEDFREWYEAA